MFEAENHDNFVSLPEFAHAIGRSEAGIRKAIYENRIVSFHRVGKSYKIHMQRGAAELGIKINSASTPKQNPASDFDFEPDFFRLDSSESRFDKKPQDFKSLDRPESDEAHSLKMRQMRARTEEMEMKNSRAREEVIDRKNLEGFAQYFYERMRDCLLQYASNIPAMLRLDADQTKFYEKKSREEIGLTLAQMEQELAKKKERIQTLDGARP